MQDLCKYFAFTLALVMMTTSYQCVLKNVIFLHTTLMKKRLNWEKFGTRSVCFLSYRDQEQDKNMSDQKSDTNAYVKGL